MKYTYLYFFFPLLLTGNNKTRKLNTGEEHKMCKADMQFFNNNNEKGIE